MRPLVVPDDTVRSLLRAVGKGEMASVGVLADYLTERELTGASRVRALWDAYHERCAYWRTYDFVRCRNWTRWEAIATEGRAMCRKTLKLYGPKWAWAAGASPPLRTFIDRTPR